MALAAMVVVTAVVIELPTCGIHHFQGRTGSETRLLAKALGDPAAGTPTSSRHHLARPGVPLSTTTRMAPRTGALPTGHCLLVATSGAYKLAYTPLASFSQPGATALALANSAPGNVLFHCQRTSPQPASPKQCWPRFHEPNLSLTKLLKGPSPFPKRKSWNTQSTSLFEILLHCCVINDVFLFRISL